MKNLKNKNATIQFEGKSEDLIELLKENIAKDSELAEIIEDAYLYSKGEKTAEEKGGAFLVLEKQDNSLTSSIVGNHLSLAQAIAGFMAQREEHIALIKQAVEIFQRKFLSDLLKELGEEE